MSARLSLRLVTNVIHDVRNEFQTQELFVEDQLKTQAELLNTRYFAEDSLNETELYVAAYRQKVGLEGGCSE
jgi:hypothetical protein